MTSIVAPSRQKRAAAVLITSIVAPSRLNCAAEIFMQQLGCSNSSAAVGLQQFFCSSWAAEILLQQLRCSNSSAAVGLQQFFCSSWAAAILLQQLRCSNSYAAVGLQQNVNSLLNIFSEHFIFILPDAVIYGFLYAIFSNIVY